MVNYTNSASDCGVSSQSVKNYIEILTDTLIANRLPAYVRRPKRKIVYAPKFYYFDVGIVNVAIEVKSSPLLKVSDLVGLRDLKIEQPQVKKRIVVCLEAKARVTEDQIQILPYVEFIKLLWGKGIF